MMTDPIADMLTRIRNAATGAPRPHRDAALAPQGAHRRRPQGRRLRRRRRVERGRGAARRLTVVLRYGRDRQARSTASAASRRPGRRVYVRHDRIPRVCSGMGISILSTTPRRDDRPRGAQAARRRRAPLRGVVIAMTTQRPAQRRPTVYAVARRQAPDRAAQGRHRDREGRHDRRQGPEGHAHARAPAERRT